VDHPIALIRASAEERGPGSGRQTPAGADLHGHVRLFRLFARAHAAFGALAVLLACFGLFGVMSYSVARRTSEIGIRVALGAQRQTVIGMVMSESARLVAVGIVLGLGVVLWAGRFVQAVIYGVSPIDPLTIGGALALIAVVTVVAGGVPARRAANVNPIEALRQQEAQTSRLLLANSESWLRIGRPIFDVGVDRRLRLRAIGRVQRQCRCQQSRQSVDWTHGAQTDGQRRNRRR
jgi:hypothetical protein